MKKAVMQEKAEQAQWESDSDNRPLLSPSPDLLAVGSPGLLGRGQSRRPGQLSLGTGLGVINRIASPSPRKASLPVERVQYPPAHLKHSGL